MGIKETCFKILGLTCKSCIKLSQRKIEEIDGVTKALVSIDGQAKVLANREIDREEIAQALQDTHFSVL